MIINTIHGNFHDWLLLAEVDGSPATAIHEFAHFMQLIATPSGALGVWGGAIALSLGRMLRYQLFCDGYKGFALPLRDIAVESVSPRAAAIVWKIRKSMATMDRLAGGGACVHAFLRPNRTDTKGACPWVPSPSNGIYRFVPISGKALREAASTLLVRCNSPLDPGPLDEFVSELGPEHPAAWVMAHGLRELGGECESTLLAIVDLSISAPPDPGYTGTAFRELHPGWRFLQLVDFCRAAGIYPEPSEEGYCRFAQAAEKALGWASWLTNTKLLITRLYPEIVKSAKGAKRSHLGAKRRLALAELIKRGGEWRLENPGALARPGIGWLEWAQGMIPFAKESGAFVIAPSSNRSRQSLSILDDAVCYVQMIFGTEVRCIYRMLGIMDRCRSFEAEKSCATYPRNDDSAVTDCDFTMFWEDWLGLPATFPILAGDSNPSCRRCFSSVERPEVVEKFILQCEARLPRDHLGAAYGGDAYFNPCLALIGQPVSNDPVSQVDAHHEYLHAVMSSVSMGRVLFLCRFLSLHLWHSWAWERIRSEEQDLQQLDTLLNGIVREVIAAWRPYQEGVAWRDSFQQLERIAAEGNASAEVLERMSLMQDVVINAGDSHPVRKGWFIGQRLEERYGQGIYQALVSRCSDPILPLPKGSLEEWRNEIVSICDMALEGISRIAQSKTPAPGGSLDEAACCLRDGSYSADMFSKPSVWPDWYAHLLVRLLLHRGLPDGYSEVARPIVEAVLSGAAGLPLRGYGFTRFGFVVEAKTDEEGTPVIKIVQKAERAYGDTLENEINRLAALNHFIHSEIPFNKRRELIRKRVPVDECFLQVLHDLIPFYQIPDAN